MFMPVFAHVSSLVDHGPLDYPHIPLVPSAITHCALDSLYLFLRAISKMAAWYLLYRLPLSDALSAYHRTRRTYNPALSSSIVLFYPSTLNASAP
ncbi:hypothetical protein B0H14DRAFT_3480811 [Mycena olivaceomarginata]|nr:hypothetical protein B0H14DRAFT_3480811 [Mycena olivaceomarginata]